jgi:hypothetical protein
VTGIGSEWSKFSEASILDGKATTSGMLKLSAFKAMCSRPYWHRLWIIQEIIFAEEIILQCGDDLISWNTLCLFFRLVMKRSKRNFWIDKVLEERESRESILLSIENSIPVRLFRRREDRLSRRFGGQARHLSWVELRLEYEESLCEDLRDKFFGLYSFAAYCCK